MITHRATLNVSRELVQYVGRLLYWRRRELGTRNGTRALTCFVHAVMVLRWFRGYADITALGRDHGISRATAYRYVEEVVGVLADQAPDLHEALARAAGEGMSHLILDGTLIETDRCGEQTTSVKGESIDLWYSGKAHRHAANVQAVSAPNGLPLWISDSEAGSVHDITAARTHVLGALYAAAAAGLPTLADSGYQSAGIGVLTPVKQPTDGKELDPDTRTFNALLRSLRCLGERGFSLLKNRWRILKHITASPNKISDIAKAALVLTHFEHGYLAESR